jgi:hypothetical protein
LSRPADVGLVEHDVGVIQGEEGETLLGSFVEHLKAEQVTRELASIYFTPYLWHILINHAEVDIDGSLTFTFREDSQVSCRC